jgi:CheY-like chemotaxis protein
MACVLIVEDDPDVREFMELLLQSSGYETMSAPNGLEALAQMRQRRPCVVLLDLMMPVMNGWEFRERQLAETAIRDVPVVCVSAVFDPHQVVQRLRVPCVRKPVEFPELLQKVEHACRTRRAQA